VTLVLASRSPQRRAILEQLGVDFIVAPSDVDERSEGDPVEVALENARLKVSSCAVPGDLVLGVDTLVTLDGRIYGKPSDAVDAADKLRALSGRVHTVVSGLAFADGRSACVQTSVTFRALSDSWIDWYVATGEWEGRAGGYAIQGRGAALVLGIDGDYSNVVGLPVAALLDLAPELLGL